MTFPTHGDVADFFASFRRDPFKHELRDSGESVVLRAQWPTMLERQGRGVLFRPVYAAMNTGVLHGRLQLSYPRARSPEIVVSVAMAYESLGELLVPWHRSQVLRFEPVAPAVKDAGGA